MARKKEKIVNKGGRPRKIQEGVKWSEVNTTIAVNKDNKKRLDQIRSVHEKNYDDTIGNLIEVMLKIGTDYLHLDNPKPQEVLNEIARQERENKKEDG